MKEDWLEEYYQEICEESDYYMNLNAVLKNQENEDV